MAVTTTVPVHRLSVEDVLAMVRAGILDEHARVELEDGVLVDMNPIGPEHRSTLVQLTEHFVVAVAGRCEVQIQDMLLIPGGGFYQPDLAVVEPVPRSKLPAAALFVLEVAQSSHTHDRAKAAVYAAMAVPEYWIVDVVAEAVVVHRDPVDGTYRSVVEHTAGAVEPLLDGVPAVALAPLFGR